MRTLLPPSARSFTRETTSSIGSELKNGMESRPETDARRTCAGEFIVLRFSFSFFVFSYPFHTSCLVGVLQTLIGILCFQMCSIRFTWNKSTLFPESGIALYAGISFDLLCPSRPSRMGHHYESWFVCFSVLFNELFQSTHLRVLFLV